jgi:hypothetical protein
MLNNLQMDTVTNNILNMVIFDKMKIGNPIIDIWFKRIGFVDQNK